MLTTISPILIRKIRKKLGFTLEDLEEKTGISNGQLSRIERGEKRLFLDTVDTIAKGLDVDPTTLIVDVDSFETIEVRGAVWGGHWVDDLWWSPEKRYTIAIPRDRRFEVGARYGLEVQGTASNLRYPEGTIVILVALPIGYRPSEPDVRFLVERKRDEQSELTIRKFQVDSRGQRWLVAETNDPEFQSPVPYEDLLTGRAEILARVVGSYMPE